MNLDEFRALPPDQQQTVLAERRRLVEEQVRAAAERVFNRHEFESTLVPVIQFKATEPNKVTVAPLPDDPDQAARDFFKRFPSTTEIRIGTTIYQRG